MSKVPVQLADSGRNGLNAPPVLAFRGLALCRNCVRARFASERLCAGLVNCIVFDTLSVIPAGDLQG